MLMTTDSHRHELVFIFLIDSPPTASPNGLKELVQLYPYTPPPYQGDTNQTPLLHDFWNLYDIQSNYFESISVISIEIVGQHPAKTGVEPAHDDVHDAIELLGLQRQPIHQGLSSL